MSLIYSFWQIDRLILVIIIIIYSFWQIGRLILVIIIIILSCRGIVYIETKVLTMSKS